MTIKMPRNLMTAISVVAFAVMLHGCGGGGGSSPATTAPDETTMDDTTTTPTTTVGQTVPGGTVITVPADLELLDITVTAVMGQTIPYEPVGTFTCASAVCSVVVADNVITTTGDIVVDAVADDSVDALLYAALNTEPVELTELQTAQAAAVTARGRSGDGGRSGQDGIRCRSGGKAGSRDHPDRRSYPARRN